MPLAIEFSKKFNVVGFDVNDVRIQDLENGLDLTNEVDESDLKKAKNLVFSSDIDALRVCNFYIITALAESI